MALERLTVRIEEIKSAGSRAMPRTSSRVQAKLRADSTTRRGNVPSYGKFGKTLSKAVATFDGLRVTAADWVLRRARALGQPAAWLAIMAEEIRRAAKGDR